VDEHGKTEKAAGRYTRHRCLALNWSKHLDTLLSITVSARPCGSWELPRGLSLYRGSHPNGRNNKGKMVNISQTVMRV
jgi:hypothetical protein